ncbi:hypothetical protein [Microvirga puerhi]|uniref:TonB C-terminal domain-containing protein n=1 Tax=Microvirga puerhi TaxID=2876078 RepID=A0ABS7VU97_9HYPH|nr:hypothetical protein [Microvirga puerhi]MBZ6079130.1 hypothetical protein [Microvirga puerhi]
MTIPATRSARRLIAAFLLAAAWAGPVAAQDLSPREDHDDPLRRLDPSPSLPEGINGTIRPGEGERTEKIDNLNGIFSALQACWRPPAGSGFSGQEVTLRIAFKRNGDVLGKPRITYYRAGNMPDQREPFTRSIQEAFTRCTPLPFSEKLGGAVAGRIFTFRFSDTRPM